jgi:hypothetical protein
MTPDTVLKVAVPLIGLLSAVIAPAAWLFREIFRYLLARIGVLEGREQTTLASLVASVKQQGEEIAAQGELIRQIAKESERRDWLRENDKGGRP